MKGGIRGVARFFLVTIGIVVLTSVTIDATDGLRGSQSALSRLAFTMTSEDCRAGTVSLELDGRQYCVDKYVAVPSEACPHQVVQSGTHTSENLNTADCAATVKAQVRPWTNVARHQAAQLCARAGKRLLTPTEWYYAALGTTVSACNTDSNQVQLTGSSDCVSGIGAYDMVGNVWELLDAEVVNGYYKDAALPTSGYVGRVSIDGFPTATQATATAMFDNDYVWTAATGTHAIMRGGFYGSRTDAGLYAMHAAIDPTFASQAVGFRCMYAQN